MWQPSQGCVNLTHAKALGTTPPAAHRIVGPPEAQFIALQHVSRQLRENPPREWPGGPPPCLTLLSAPAAAPAAAAPVYQQPVQQGYQPAPSYQPAPVYGGQPAGQPVYAPAQPAYQPPQQQVKLLPPFRVLSRG